MKNHVYAIMLSVGKINYFKYTLYPPPQIVTGSSHDPEAYNIAGSLKRWEKTRNNNEIPNRVNHKLFFRTEAVGYG